MTEPNKMDMPDEIWAYDDTGTGKGTWYDEDVTGPHTKPGSVVKYTRSHPPTVTADEARDVEEWLEKHIDAVNQILASDLDYLKPGANKVANVIGVIRRCISHFIPEENQSK